MLKIKQEKKKTFENYFSNFTFWKVKETWETMCQICWRIGHIELSFGFMVLGCYHLGQVKNFSAPPCIMPSHFLLQQEYKEF